MKFANLSRVRLVALVKVLETLATLVVVHLKRLGRPVFVVFVVLVVLALFGGRRRVLGRLLVFLRAALLCAALLSLASGSSDWLVLLLGT